MKTTNFSKIYFICVSIIVLSYTAFISYLYTLFLQNETLETVYPLIIFTLPGGMIPFFMQENSTVYIELLLILGGVLNIILLSLVFLGIHKIYLKFSKKI